MPIELNPDLEAYAETRARELGLQSASDWISRLVEAERQREPTVSENGGRGWEVVKQMTGTATSGLSTDDILAMTREQ